MDDLNEESGDQATTDAASTRPKASARPPEKAPKKRKRPQAEPDEIDDLLVDQLLQPSSPNDSLRSATSPTVAQTGFLKPAGVSVPSSSTMPPTASDATPPKKRKKKKKLAADTAASSSAVPSV